MQIDFFEAAHTVPSASNRVQSSNISRQMDLFEAANRPQPSTLSEQMDCFEAANKNGIRCSAPAQTPVLVSAGEYYKDPGIGLGGAGGMSGLEAMSALKVAREDTSFHGFVEGEVDEDETTEMEMEGQELPEGIDEHDKFYVNC
jgi:hypothetical protein